MAKKKFGVSQTLSVQPKQLSPDEVEKAIQQIHQPAENPTVKQAQPTEKKQKTQPSKPKADTASSKEKKVSEKIPKATSIKKSKDPNRRVRLSVDVSRETHKRLKIRAIEQDSDIMHYVEMLIEKDLAKKK